jgi:hypothetical protein
MNYSVLKFFVVVVSGLSVGLIQCADAGRAQLVEAILASRQQALQSEQEEGKREAEQQQLAAQKAAALKQMEDRGTENDLKVLNLSRVRMERVLALNAQVNKVLFGEQSQNNRENGEMQQ